MRNLSIITQFLAFYACFSISQCYGGDKAKNANGIKKDTKKPASPIVFDNDFLQLAALSTLSKQTNLPQ